MSINFSENRDRDIILMGRVAIDFNPTDINMPLENSQNFKRYLGGSPANIAVGMARLGKKVGFIGCVSDDQFGRFVTSYFEKESIDISKISTVKNGESLGLTFTEIKSPTESSILMYRNGVADLQIDPLSIDEEYIKNSKILLISGTALAASPSREACFVAIEYAKKHNVKIIFDIDYRSYTWKNTMEISVYYSLVGKQSDIIIGSREEFNLIERLILDENKEDKVSADKWIGYGNQIVIIKHGKEGSNAYTGKGEFFQVKPFPVKLLKSFGGGDAYASAFIYGLLEKWDIKKSLEFGSAAAAMLVASHSCSEDMPTPVAIQEFIDSHKKG